MAFSKSEYSLDEEIDRHSVPALKVHPIVLGEDGNNLFAGGVADIDFKAPPAVLDALQKRLDHAVYSGMRLVRMD